MNTQLYNLTFFLLRINIQLVHGKKKLGDPAKNFAEPTKKDPAKIFC